MKTKRLAAFAAAIFASIASGHAAVMNITVDSTGSFLQNGTEPDGVLSLASDAFFSSFQDPASTANNKENNFNFLQGVIENWNGNRSPLLPEVTSWTNEAADNGNVGGANSFTTASGYDYVVFHFGNGQAGAGGGPNNADENGWWSAWYLGGESHTFSLPTEGDPLQPVGGFSSALYFKASPRTVPDGGSTVVALGIGLLGLGGMRRFLLKA